MGAVCLAPVLASLMYVALTSAARTSQVLIGFLGAVFGFLLGLVALFCGVLMPLSSLGLSGQPGNGSSSFVGAVGLSAGIAAVAAVVLSLFVTKGLAKAVSRRELSQ